MTRSSFALTIAAISALSLGVPAVAANETGTASVPSCSKTVTDHCIERGAAKTPVSSAKAGHHAKSRHHAKRRHLARRKHHAAKKTQNVAMASTKPQSKAFTPAKANSMAPRAK